MEFLQKVDPIGASIAIVSAIIIIYLGYMYFSKDNKDDSFDYVSFIYSLIIGIILGILIFFGYCKYKPRNCELLREDFYS